MQATRVTMSSTSESRFATVTSTRDPRAVARAFARSMRPSPFFATVHTRIGRGRRAFASSSGSSHSRIARSNRGESNSIFPISSTTRTSTS